MEIVYCGGCGKALRGDDFDRGRAVILDNRPWCFECRPPDKTPISLPGAVVAKATPKVDAATLSRDILGTDPATALANLGTVSLSRDGSVSEAPASDALRGIFEEMVKGHRT